MHRGSMICRCPAFRALPRSSQPVCSRRCHDIPRSRCIPGIRPNLLSTPTRRSPPERARVRCEPALAGIRLRKRSEHGRGRRMSPLAQPDDQKGEQYSPVAGRPAGKRDSFPAKPRSVPGASSAVSVSAHLARPAHSATGWDSHRTTRRLFRHGIGGCYVRGRDWGQRHVHSP